MSVRLWVGPMGSGKTLSVVMDLNARRRRNPELPIMTNLERLDLPGVPVQYISVDMGLQNMFLAMARFREGVMFLDEAGVFLPSRMWSKIPLELSAYWAQARKHSVDVFITGLWVGSIVKDLREIVMDTTVCSSFRMWGFFLLRRYSGTMVGNKKFMETWSIRFFRPGIAGKLYDTMGRVKAPDWGGRGGSLERVITDARPPDSVIPVGASVDVPSLDSRSLGVPLPVERVAVADSLDDGWPTPGLR